MGEFINKMFAWQYFAPVLFTVIGVLLLCLIIVLSLSKKDDKKDKETNKKIEMDALTAESATDAFAKEDAPATKVETEKQEPKEEAAPVADLKPIEQDNLVDSTSSEEANKEVEIFAANTTTEAPSEDNSTEVAEPTASDIPVVTLDTPEEPAPIEDVPVVVSDEAPSEDIPVVVSEEPAPEEPVVVTEESPVEDIPVVVADPEPEASLEEPVVETPTEEVEQGEEPIVADIPVVAAETPETADIPVVSEEAPAVTSEEVPAVVTEETPAEIEEPIPEENKTEEVPVSETTPAEEEVKTVEVTEEKIRDFRNSFADLASSISKELDEINKMQQEDYEANKDGMTVDLPKSIDVTPIDEATKEAVSSVFSGVKPVLEEQKEDEIPLSNKIDLPSIKEEAKEVKEEIPTVSAPDLSSFETETYKIES